MKTISVTFKKFSEISLWEALECDGCYVLWDSQSRSKASYIGSGNVVKRLGSHGSNYSFPIDGYVAFVDSYDDALIVEAILIDAAFNTDRVSHNVKNGNWSLIEKICKKEKSNLVKLR